MNCQDSLPFENTQLSASACLGSRVDRPRTAGKFLFSGEEKLWVRGVTYGTFAADAQTRFIDRLEPQTTSRWDVARSNAQNGLAQPLRLFA